MLIWHKTKDGKMEGPPDMILKVKPRKSYRLLYWLLSKTPLGRAILWKSWLDGYEMGMKMYPVAIDIAAKYPARES